MTNREYLHITQYNPLKYRGIWTPRKDVQGKIYYSATLGCSSDRHERDISYKLDENISRILKCEGITPYFEIIATQDDYLLPPKPIRVLNISGIRLCVHIRNSGSLGFDWNDHNGPPLFPELSYRKGKHGIPEMHAP